MPPYVIEFSRVSKRYANGFEALSHVSFGIQKGEMAFLTGHSGAGKSTVLKLITLLEMCSQGNILLNGQNLRHLRSREIPYLRRNIGMIWQDPRLLQERTVLENVALPLMIMGTAKAEVERRVRAALDKVGLLGKEMLYPQYLSGGEQQRVGIARAIVHKPALLLADEPTGNLDPNLSTEIMDLFQQFNRVGVSVLIASHDLALIARYKHRMLTLKQGRLIGEG